MGAISVENLFSKVSDDVVGYLGTLTLNNQPDEFSHRLGHVILVVEQIDDLLYVGALHVADVFAILIHANLQYVKKRLFEVSNFGQLLVIFQQVETRLYQALYEIFVHYLIDPKHVNLFF